VKVAAATANFWNRERSGSMNTQSVDVLSPKA
jgi:hypothetical protein